jgi:transposase
MTYRTTQARSMTMGQATGLTVGLDVSDIYTSLCILDEEGNVVEEGRVRTTMPALERRFSVLSPCRVVLEVGTHSPWMSRLLAGFGHEVIVANPRQVRLISQSDRKRDRTDAEQLARLGRVDPALLRPIQHRGSEAQHDLALLRTRDVLVRARTNLINHVRGAAKATGSRLPACSAASFHRKAEAHLPLALRAILLPIVSMVAELTARIREYDRQVQRSGERYPAEQLLRQVQGVGPLTALAFLLVIEDPERFRKSREVGPYLGLVPRQSQSGEREPQLSITKAGDPLLRRLLVQSAHYILGPFGADSELRRWGLRLAGSGSSRNKKRAVVAVARKLAVLLHRLWVTGEVYEPLSGARVIAARTG